MRAFVSVIFAHADLPHSSNELELFTELNGMTFANDRVLTLLSINRIVLGGGVDQVSFRWQDTPTDQDPDVRPVIDWG